MRSLGRDTAMKKFLVVINTDGLLSCALGWLHVACSGFLAWFLRKPFNVLTTLLQRRYREGR